MAIITTSFFNDVLVVAILLLTVAIAYFKRSLTYWESRRVYTLPATIPFGNATELAFQRKFIGFEFKDLYDIIKRKGFRYGGYYFFTKPIFVPVDLDLIKRIMTQDFSHFTDHVNYVDAETEPLTGHLFSLKGQKWKQLRSKLTPTFTTGKMKMMFQILIDCTSELNVLVEQTLERCEAIDIKDVVARFTTDVIGSCAFGLECNSLRNPKSEFREYGQKFFDTSLWDSIVRLMSILCPEVISYTKIRTLRKEINDFFMNVVIQTVNFREQNNVTRKDFMQLLIQLKNKIDINDNEVEELNGATETNGVKNSNGTSITLNELAAQCFVFFLAGFETSSTTSTFVLYEMVQNPQVQEKAREEINAVLAKYDGRMTYEGIMEMTYLDKCINETLRKYPPVPIHMRECTETYKIPDSDIVLNKGSFVFIPVLGIQRDPDLYPDPDKFDPERFSDENRTRHPSAWIPFGDGPRTCIGLRFGMLQIKVGLAALLKNFRFTLNPKTATPLVLDPRMPLILTVEKGVWLDATKIT